ncbi:hypothetical protein ACFU53_30545 [Streptomyces sp. NPDC057474]|uniref:hypothetical protein n=1 Tax=Streptomyces sp. NPDC057474 TaxID=3346144 RepID=UPI003685399C
MRRRVAEHPDPAIRHAYADFVRGTVDLGIAIGIDGLEQAYGRPRTALAEDPHPKLRAAVAQAWSVDMTAHADREPPSRDRVRVQERPVHGRA